MKRILLLLLLAVSLLTRAQVIEKVNKIIKEKCYTSYYSEKIEGPSFVIYKIYKGGGNISRGSMNFSSPYKHFNYSRSGYDKGHLCPAEDFAYSKVLEENTFRYYNTVPMTPRLNRGIWKVYENKVRKLSQTDSILVVCGGCDYKGLIPGKCFKIAYSLKTGKVYFSYIFYNTGTVKEGEENNKLLDLFKDFAPTNP